MKTIAITSGKGGVGKTTFSANLAIALSQFGQNVVLFDADLQLANVDVAIGLRAEHTLKDVIDGNVSLAESLTRGPAGIRVAVGGSAVTKLMTAGPKRLGQFFEEIRGLEQDTDVLLYDTAAGLENRVVAFLKESDEIVLVTTPDPTAVTDAYAAAKIAWKRNPDAIIRVVVNMVSSPEEGLALFNHLNLVSQNFLGRELFYLGHVRVDMVAAHATRVRKPYVLHAPQSEAAQDVVDIARLVWDQTRAWRARPVAVSA